MKLNNIPVTENRRHFLHIMMNQNKLIVVGDFNAHNKKWSHAKPNNLGRLIPEFCNELKLTVMNIKDKQTHINSQTGKVGSPDITLSSQELIKYLKWEIGEDMSSDHLPMIITLNKNVNRNVKFRRSHWVIRKLDEEN